MAHTKSARKRVRQGRKRHQRNIAVKSRVRTTTKAFRAEIEEGDAARVGAVLRTAEAELRKAASKGVISPRTASRRVSRLAKAASAKSAAK